MNFLEDVEQDRKYRNQATRIYNRIEAIRDRFGEYAQGQYIVIPFSEFSNYLREDVLILAPIDKRPAEGVYAGVGKFTGPGFENALIVYVTNPKIMKDRLWGSIVLEEGRIVHELIHLMDNRRSPNLPSMNPDGSIDPKKYYNHPHEFNAYYQEGMTRLEELLELIEKKTPDFFSEKMSTFDDFYKFAIQRFDSGFRQNINSRYERKLKKRLAAYYQDIRS